MIARICSGSLFHAIDRRNKRELTKRGSRLWENNRAVTARHLARMEMNMRRNVRALVCEKVGENKQKKVSGDAMPGIATMRGGLIPL